MIRTGWLALVLLAGLVAAHDLSMAAMGHPVALVEATAQAPADRETSHGHHHAGTDQTPGEPEEAIPEACGTVRLVPARQHPPEHSPLPDPILGTTFAPWQAMTQAISVNLLASPVLDSPGACLARFQVFRI